MAMYYHRCQRCRRVFKRRDESKKCTDCNYDNYGDTLIKIEHEPVESGWFKGEKYL